MSTNHLYDGLTRHARTRPDARFAVIWDGREYRYGDIDRVSARFANALVARGVRPGDRVAAQVEKSIEALMLYLATVRAGAVFQPLNTAYTAAEIGYFLGDAEYFRLGSIELPNAAASTMRNRSGPQLSYTCRSGVEQVDRAGASGYRRGCCHSGRTRGRIRDCLCRVA
jgi:acyl-CoA synthetase (AMP-forming)/AMP-acid ligase II